MIECYDCRDNHIVGCLETADRNYRFLCKTCMEKYSDTKEIPEVEPTPQLIESDKGKAKSLFDELEDMKPHKEARKLRLRFKNR